MSERHISCMKYLHRKFKLVVIHECSSFKVQHPSLKNKLNRFATLAAASLFLFSSTANAQDRAEIPQIPISVIADGELNGNTGIALATKNPRVSSQLNDILGRFTNSGEGDTVVIEAIAVNSSSALLEGLIGLGLSNGSAFGNLVSGTLPLSAVSAAQRLPELSFIQLANPIVRVGSVTSQADAAIRADQGRSAFGVNGTGITIGILSDSYDQLGGEATDIASGDLPSNVAVIDDTAFGSNTDEGRAMAQLIHDLAPGAELAFHTAFNGRPDFAQGILDLQAAGASVIVDDVGYLTSPMFQDGVIAQAVDTVVDNGAIYFSAAGNTGNASYENDYNDSGTELPDLQLTNVHHFDPTDPTDLIQEILVPSGGEIQFSFQWDQPFASAGGAGASTDVDIFLIDAGSTVLAFGANSNIGNDAVEILSWFNSTGADQVVGLIVGVFNGSGLPPGKIKWIDFGGPKAHNQPTNSSTVFAHPNSESAIAVGAAFYADTPEFGTSPPLIEAFSSHGGLEVIFDTDGNSIPPQDRQKPEIVAPDGTDTTFFGNFDADGNGFPNFFGTSAAAPHAAAVAALIIECAPGVDSASMEAGFTNTSVDMETPGYDVISGIGLIDVPSALDFHCSQPVAFCNGLPATVNLALGETPGPGDDVVVGTPGNDDIRGRAGNDTICGMGGDDFIHGNSGNDWIDGGSGIDNIRGGQGDDIIFTGSGATVGTSSRAFGGTGDDFITGGVDADDLRGGRGDDELDGLGGNDELRGNDDNDLLSGRSGDDELLGGQGDDTLNGNGGDDICNGGGGTGDVAAPNCETVVNIP